MQAVTSFGDGGGQPGQFFGVHSIAGDSRGNLYTTETWEGKRIQEFVYKGLGAVSAGPQGVVLAARDGALAARRRTQFPREQIRLT